MRTSRRFFITRVCVCLWASLYFVPKPSEGSKDGAGGWWECVKPQRLKRRRLFLTPWLRFAKTKHWEVEVVSACLLPQKLLCSVAASSDILAKWLNKIRLVVVAVGRRVWNFSEMLLTKVLNFDLRVKTFLAWSSACGLCANKLKRTFGEV